MLKLKLNININPILLLLIFTTQCFSYDVHASEVENDAIFDSIFYQTLATTSTSNIEQALHIADSLYENSTNKYQKMKSAILKSSLFQQKGNSGYAVLYAEEAYKTAVEMKDYGWQARLLGFLANRYRLIELYDEGFEYLQKGKIATSKIEDPERKTIFMGLALEEEAYFMLAEEEIDKAYSLALQAGEYFTKIKDEKERVYFLANNQETLAEISIGNENWEDALKHYQNLQDYLDENELDNKLTVFLHFGLAKTYLELNQTSNVLDHLYIVDSLTKKAEFNELDEKIYKLYSDYYKKENDLDNYVIYNEKYQKLKTKNAKVNKELIQQFLKETKIKNEGLHKNRSSLFVVSISLVLVILILIVRHQYTKRKNYREFKKKLNQLRSEINLESSTIVESELNDEEAPTIIQDERVMTEEMEQAILLGLKKFEEHKKFLDKNISLAMVSNIIKANSKYVSHVINSQKNKNFNAYINKLRIKYIVQKLENEEVYRRYSISYLAEEAGFSSHSKFSSVFKSITGYSPSLFIKYIEKNKKENNLS